MSRAILKVPVLERAVAQYSDERARPVPRARLASGDPLPHHTWTIG